MPGPVGSHKQTTSWNKAFRGMPTQGVDLDSMLCDAELASIAAAKNGGPYNEKREVCSCVETRINGKHHALHRPQDCNYCQARSKLVDEASRRASKKVGELPVDADDKQRSEHGLIWTVAFVRQMEKLAAPLLKQSGNGIGSNGSAPAASEAQSVPPGPPNDETQAAIVCWKA